eukprot:461485_1
MSSLWISLQDCPISICNCPLQINDNIIISLPNCTTEETICKYNIADNVWSEFLTYPTDSGLKYLTAAMHHETNTIYAHGDSGELLKINLTDNTCSIIDTNYKPDIDPYVTIIENNIHLIGGFSSKKHVVWNHNTNKFDDIHTFEEWSCGNSSFAFIHITYQNRMLLLGGYDGRACSSGKTDCIWSYTISNQQWKLLNNIKLPYPMNTFGCVLTSNEKFVIIISGSVYVEKTISNNEIYILNLLTLEWRKSNIQSPIKGTCFAIRVGNHMKYSLTTYGYVRNQFKQMKQMLPVDIINMIVMWYEADDIYLFEGSQCWKMCINDVLKSVSW